MDFLSHINLGEMFGDLTVTAFLILQPTSVVVVGSIVIFPLIDLASPSYCANDSRAR